MAQNNTAIQNLESQIDLLIKQISELQLRLIILKDQNSINTNNSCTIFSRNLFFGSTDITSAGEVSKLQKVLMEGVSSNLNITGIFEINTQKAVQALQTKYGVVSSGSPQTTGFGVFGPLTRSAVNNRCNNVDNVVNNPVQTDTSIRVIYPNGGETFTKGYVYNINWNNNLTSQELIQRNNPRVKIDLIPTDVPQGTYTIVEGAENSGVYNWFTSQATLFNDDIYEKAIPDGQYRIRVCANISNTATSALEPDPRGVGGVQYQNVQSPYVYPLCDTSDSTFSLVSNNTQVREGSPFIQSVDGPTSLSVNQVATWTVKASDSEVGALTYKVRWGDESIYSGDYYSQTSNQNGVFSHFYQKPGVYSIVFVVTDQDGNEAKSSLVVRVDLKNYIQSNSSLSVGIKNGGVICVTTLLCQFDSLKFTPSVTLRSVDGNYIVEKLMREGYEGVLFDRLLAGQYILELSASDYNTVTKEITIAESSKTNLDITLYPANNI
jgi:peptidoglycan hydrolase-like protein with peptidoglycan-binding domain